ncbi:MerR family transcriptional regulator [Aeromonas lacus]|nr:MerR family transcriptional regulator [Aeromonas lacus]
MLTITRLARELGLSRTTLLYYERLSLLLPALRGE